MQSPKTFLFRDDLGSHAVFYSNEQNIARVFCNFACQRDSYLILSALLKYVTGLYVLGGHI